MFETAVKKDSELAVVAHGGQQNGAILGNGCAMFLTKFMAKLIARYNTLCVENSLKPEVLDKPTYKIALEETLIDLSVEDMKENGRLLLLNEKFISLCSEEMSQKSLAPF